uniref:Pentatricopeptide repeat-containing protein n=1 Tax=Tanacetum cinerariifolium TaxID=118510 RepID=A0A6L2KUI7_TANCI|nr:hypothetical protein [Tanacetum cinerariifolium]
MIISAIQAAISRFTNNNECTVFLTSLKAVGEVTDVKCFGVLFGFYGKLKKLEEAKKVHDYFLRSGITGDVELVHKMIDMYWNGVGNDGRRGISLKIEHYLGLISCYGKPGHLAEVLEYIQMLSFEPTSEIWEAMMNYARIHGDIDLEDKSEEIMINLDP